jgi:hypothetical protein
LEQIPHHLVHAEGVAARRLHCRAHCTGNWPRHH